MDVCTMIKQRLAELGLEQKDLATAAGVTDSYISQLLTRKKLPPAPDRTDIYSKIGKFLKLPADNLSELAKHQRTEELKKNLPQSPVPLFKEARELVLRKCIPEKQGEIRSIFERQPFGELERLVTHKLLEVVQRIAKRELENERWLRLVARMSGRRYEETRVNVLEFLDTDVFNISAENCIFYLDPLIDSWDIDLANFGIEIVLNRRLATAPVRTLEFVEREADSPAEEQPALQEFLRNASMSGDASEQEIAFLRKLQFAGKRPTALYYYRELQNLRDPLNFRETSVAPLQKYADAMNVNKQMQIHAREGAIQRWAENKGRKRRKSKTPR